MPAPGAGRLAAAQRPTRSRSRMSAGPLAVRGGGDIPRTRATDECTPRGEASWEASGRPYGHLGQLGERAVEPLLRELDIPQRLGEVRVVGAEIEMTMAGEVEEDHPRVADLSRGRGFFGDGPQRVRRLGCRQDALAARETHGL